MTRTGMSTLINDLRGLTNTNTSDWTLGTANYWDDAHMQAVLDVHRTDFFEAVLYPIQQTNASGEAVYYRYESGVMNWESMTSGTAYFYLTTSAGSVVGTANYTPDYKRGHVVFSADQGGTAYYLTGRAFDLLAAAGEIWQAKAAHYAESYDFSTDGHNFRRSQLIDHCNERAAYYKGLAGVRVIDLERRDTA